ncbi:MAG TPA: signal peptidase I [Lysobacter sp.]|nr:signal peptidase I [Lysobacter sp.]
MRWFEIALVSLTLFTGVVWLLDKLVFAKRRAAQADRIDSDGKEPAIIDYSKAFFPVLAVVLILRSFVAEPFRIPSNSMMPTLLTGDFILVNKFTYGLRLPVTNTKFVEIGAPARGDVVVFRPPQHPEQDWIKRVVGLPGDRIEFVDNQLLVNGQPVEYDQVGSYTGTGKGAEMTGASELIEKLPGHSHRVLETPDIAYFGESAWEVPAGHYFVMGDNRDRSEDSRAWGFLPEQNIRGRAFLIWLNCEGWFCSGAFDTSRIGTRIP